MNVDDPDRPRAPAGSLIERRIWIAGYVVTLLVIGAGAGRQLWKLFG